MEKEVIAAVTVRSGNKLYLYTVQDILQVDMTGLGALSTALYQMAAAVCHHVSASIIPAMSGM